MPRKSRRRPHNMGTVYQRGPDNFWVAFRINGRRRYWRGYAHLKTDLFSPADLAAMTIDLSRGDARTGAVGYVVATQEVDERAVKS